MFYLIHRRGEPVSAARHAEPGGGSGAAEGPGWNKTGGHERTIGALHTGDALKESSQHTHFPFELV